MNDRALWAVLLAGGEGERVRALTLDRDGNQAPKQFCALDGPESLLRRTIARARRLVSAERTLVVVAERHRRWWERDLADLPRDNVVVQPANRGTGPALLLPLLDLLARDPQAEVIVLPAGHHVDDEATFCAGIREAALLAGAYDDPVVLLGVEPREFACDNDWIVPGPVVGPGPLRAVAAIAERPESGAARRLMQQGALVDSSILVASARALVGLFEHGVPWLVESLSGGGDVGRLRGPALETLYRGLAVCDFAGQILAPSLVPGPGRTAVLPIPDCGFCHLGTPARIMLFRARRQLTVKSAGVPALPGSWFG